MIYTFLACVAGVSLLRPWIGIISAYLFIILTPQCIWWWAFSGIQRPVYWILLPTVIGFVAAILRGVVGFAPLKNKLNFFIALLWLCFVLSYFLGPYVHVYSEYRFNDPKQILNLVNKIFLLYFMAVCCIDTEWKLKCLVLVIICSTVYLIWWTNAQYFFEGHYGRIGGPTPLHGISIYTDENTFGMLFVVGLPFLYFAGLYFKRKILRFGLWTIIPFGWHAIFLTGSRGALVGLIASFLVLYLLSARKLFISIILILFVAFYMWQAGSVMKSRATTITEYNKDTSASTRIEAWQAAVNMILAHPFTGVGLASFGPAFPHYSTAEPRVAHNSFFEVAAETGVFGGAMWLLIFFSIFRSCRRNGQILKGMQKEFLYLLNEAVLVSISGFFICSLFLSVELYELIYFLWVVQNSVSFLVRNESYKLGLQVDEQGLLMDHDR